MKILRVIATVDPATGGPIAGLKAVTPALARLGHQTEFLTVDSPDAGFLKDFLAPVHARGPARGGYSYAPLLKPWLEQNCGGYDAIIVHGLWQYLGRTVRQVAQAQKAPPYFVFPHGMLDPSLRATYPLRHVRKWLYWLAVEKAVLRDARAVFFTCEEERRLARLTFPLYRCRERVLAYGSSSPAGDPGDWRRAWHERFPAIADRRYFLFLGRLHSKKGLDVLLRGYAELSRASTEAEKSALPDLVVAGPASDGDYLAYLQALARSNGISAKVHWTGMLDGEAKWGALRGAEAFVLTSHQENFGIAVAEALACGTPVLISNRVNIWREISEANAGLVEPPTDRGATELLRRWMGLDSAARLAMREAARACFEQRFEIGRAAKNLADELSGLIAGPVSPA